MKVILTKEVLGLGDPGEMVQVKDGYARNYLVPQKMAIIATKNNMAMVEAERKRIALQQAKVVDEMQALSKALKALSLKLTMRAGDSGKLYGSVTNMDVASLLAASGHDIDRRRIIMEPIKKLGNHQIKIKLHPQVIVDLDLLVDAGTQPATAEADNAAEEAAPTAGEAQPAPEDAPAEA